MISWFALSKLHWELLPQWSHFLSLQMAMYPEWFWGSWTLFVCSGIILWISEQDLRHRSYAIGLNIPSSDLRFNRLAIWRHHTLHTILCVLTMGCWIAALGLLGVWMGLF